MLPNLPVSTRRTLWSPASAYARNRKSDYPGMNRFNEIADEVASDLAGYGKGMGFAWAHTHFLLPPHQFHLIMERADYGKSAEGCQAKILNLSQACAVAPASRRWYVRGGTGVPPVVRSHRRDAGATNATDAPI